jgi:sarcosine oxidase
MTQSEKFDAIVVGVGGMGSAALYHLAQRGKRVLGIERFGIAHDMGSSHGVTRIIRMAYYEDPSYVPLLRRSYELWRDLEASAGEQILHITGGIDAGLPDSRLFQGALSSCIEHELEHDILTSDQLSKRFPGFSLPSEVQAIYQADAGFLTPERCIELQVAGAQEHGAKVHTKEQAMDISETSSGVRVVTDQGEYEVETAVICAGAWTGKLLPELAPNAVPERQVLIWTEPLKPESYTPETFPIFLLMVEEGQFYGFPAFDVPGFKIGRLHHLEEIVDPDTIDREPNSRDESMLRQAVERYFPDAAGPTLSMKACMFTNTPDEHFLIDRLKPDSAIVVAAGFTGHGFKFCSVVGEILADMAINGETQHNVGMFKIGRFA